MLVYALLLLFFLAAAEWGFRASDGTASRDANLVYCLAPAHLDGLVNAAVSLGLAGVGSDPAAMHVRKQNLPLTQWRAAHKADFDRACDAYATSSNPAPAAAAPGAGVQSVLDILLPVIAGALLTVAADDIKRMADRRWAEAVELRAAWAAFRAAVQAYLKERAKPLTRGLPPTTELDVRRGDLKAVLLKIRFQHRKSPTIEGLQDKLIDDLGQPITEGWDGKESRAKQITDCLGTYGTSLEKVAGILERRIWLSRKL
jgi:hypothetical protein